ncbi:MAG: HipA domain-containing protein, partial [Bacteroidetes bacterium]|nr:HipA domain-containing protein [Bacteroidota bacterium]
VIARNQDDHVKNIAFLMDREGRWSLSPAFDMIYSYNPRGAWTSSHQMTINGKRDHFTFQDFKTCAEASSMKRGAAERIVEEVQSAVLAWPDFADEADVDPLSIERIQKVHRTDILTKA